jgi:hypothetical protein
MFLLPLHVQINGRARIPDVQLVEDTRKVVFQGIKYLSL